MRFVAVLIAGLLLVACSSSASGEGESADAPAAESAETVVPSTVVGPGDAGGFNLEESDEAALERQYGYLEDGVLTDEEYDAAFRAFMDCANRRGAHVEIRGVDPDSGQIRYSNSEEFETAEECYWTHFGEVDAWFQTTNPAVLQQMDEEDRRVWSDLVVPCLTRFGVNVPDHLDGTELTLENDAAASFMELYLEHLEAGSCE